MIFLWSILHRHFGRCQNNSTEHQGIPIDKILIRCKSAELECIRVTRNYITSECALRYLLCPLKYLSSQQCALLSLQYHSVLSLKSRVLSLWINAKSTRLELIKLLWWVCKFSVFWVQLFHSLNFFFLCGLFCFSLKVHQFYPVQNKTKSILKYTLGAEGTI